VVTQAVPREAAPESGGANRPQWRPRVPRIVGWVVRVAAVIAVLDVLDPAERPKPLLGPAMDALVDGTSFATAMCSAGAMLVLAGALQRRKRRAWNLMVVVVLAGAVAHLKAERWFVVAINLAVLGLLVWARKDFTARSERATRRAALRVFVVLGTVSFIAGLFLTARTAPGSPMSARLVETFFGLIGFTPDLEFPRTYASDVTEFALNSLGALTALLTLVALLRPARKAPALSAQDEERLRDLLSRFGGRDSLGYFALRGDKTAIFSPSGKAAVVYRVIGSVTLASGDPVGDPEAWPQAIEAWLDEAYEYAWTPGVVGASEVAAIAYRRAGLDSLEMGDEAVLDLEEFSLEGRSMRGVRQAVNRVRRAGYTLDVRRQRDLGTEDLVEVITTADALREEDVERGFSMALGRLGDSRDPDLLIARTRDGDGRLVAVLAFVPWGTDGLSLDLMRRAQGSENGTVEFVVTGVVEAVRAMGVTRISLNFAVFRSVFERGSRVGAGPVLRVWHRLLMIASKWWQIESLYRANVKYNPEWVPRFVCFRKAAELPRVVIAAAEAEAFIQRPRLRWLAP
jgi:lysyl-tRNA synthetase, class II